LLVDLKQTQGGNYISVLADLKVQMSASWVCFPGHVIKMHTFNSVSHLNGLLNVQNKVYRVG